MQFPQLSHSIHVLSRPRLTVAFRDHVASFWPNPNTPSHNLRMMYVRLAAQNNPQTTSTTTTQETNGDGVKKEEEALARTNGEVKLETPAAADVKEEVPNGDADAAGAANAAAPTNGEARTAVAPVVEAT